MLQINLLLTQHFICPLGIPLVSYYRGTGSQSTSFILRNTGSPRVGKKNEKEERGLLRRLEANDKQYLKETLLFLLRYKGLGRRDYSSLDAPRAPENSERTDLLRAKSQSMYVRFWRCFITQCNSTYRFWSFCLLFPYSTLII